MMSLLKKWWHAYRLTRAKKKVFASVKIGKANIILATANVELLNGSSKEDVQIGDYFKLSGELISSHHGKIKIGDHCLVGPRCVVGAANEVVIGNHVMVSNNVVIIDNNNHPVNPIDRIIMINSGYGHVYRSWKYAVSKPIVIHDNVWIGRNSIINKGVTIGENSIVAAGSVVTKDVPPNCIVGGNPAKVVKTDIDKEPRLIPDND